MKAFYIVLLFISIGYFALGQSITNVDPIDLPQKIKVSGKTSKAYKWADKDTIHYFLFSESGLHKTYPDFNDSISGYVDGYPVYSSEYQMTDAEYYFYHYIAYENDVQLLWKIYDYVKECPFDTRFRFISDAFTVTDLDSNGHPEIWVLYTLSCTSDVSPDDFKLIMYQGVKKYAIRGITRDYENNPVLEIDSEKEINANFIDGNPDFLKYALSLWKRNNQYPK